MFSCELWGISRNNFLTEYVRMTASNDLFWKKKKQCFPVNFAKFFRTPFLQKNSGRLQNTLTNCHSQQIQVHIITLLKRYSNSLCQVGNNTPPKCNIYTYKINVLPRNSLLGLSGHNWESGPSRHTKLIQGNYLVDLKSRRRATNWQQRYNVSK